MIGDLDLLMVFAFNVQSNKELIQMHPLGAGIAPQEVVMFVPLTIRTVILLIRPGKSLTMLVDMLGILPSR